MIDRRTLLKSAVAVAAGLALPRTTWAANADDGYIDILRAPDRVTIVTDDDSGDAQRSGERWERNGVVVRTSVAGDQLHVSLASANAAVKRIELSWDGPTTNWQRVLGDHWERSYGDLGWQPVVPATLHPWYLLANAGSLTHAFGVRTRPAAFCGWRASERGLTLACDVRNGGVGVQLGDRTLDVCDVVARRGSEGESAFAAQVAFCKAMCPKPRLADHIVYGSNDWYYAYGHNTPANLIGDAALLGEWTKGWANRPYAVIDDGWQTKTPAREGQWSATRPSFTPMNELAAAIAEHDVRPGIWMRPLLDELHTWPAEWRLARDAHYLDPSRPEVRQVVANDIKRLCDWGYKLIKHDFSSFDLLGRWGKDMAGGAMTTDGWHFAARNQTTAQIINEFYDTIRAAAGDRALIIGCNTMSHLSAGVFELNRIGDDTSGNEWPRVPKMGVNTLAFRAAQHNAFYAADADCCPITPKLEWAKASRWLDLVARSGTTLFVSVDRKALTPEIERAVRSALETAAKPLPLGEPLDWMERPSPTRWRLDGNEATFDWA